MKPLKIITLVMAIMAITFLSGPIPSLARIYDIPGPAKPALMQGRVEIQFETDVEINQLSTSNDQVSFGIPTLDKSLANIGAVEAYPMFPWREGADAIRGNDDLSKYFEIIFSEEIDINAAIEVLTQNPYVRSVAPVYALPLEVDPDDSYFDSYQWNLRKINDTAAYNVETGSDTVKIAMIDSGVLYKHADLKNNIWVNPGEDLDNDMVVYDIDDSNLVDNDGNYYDDLIGYDFFTGFSYPVRCWAGEDCSIPDNNPDDFNGHGTHCAGIAAAMTNNYLGVAGVAGGWGGGRGAYRGPRIMCIRVGGSADHATEHPGEERGYVNSANCRTAIDYAVLMGADVINCSWGMPSGYDPTWATTLLSARDAGVVICHAAGNEGSTDGDWPDEWKPDNGQKIIVTVAASASNDYAPSWSNYGTWVDICAPGVNIMSTYSEHYTPSYASVWGTSQATPHVVGVVALIKSHIPDWGYDEIVPLIYSNADPMPDPKYAQGYLGQGRVNAFNCLDSLATALFSAGPVLIGEAPLTVEFQDRSPYNPISWDWDFGDGSDASGVSYVEHEYTDYGLYTVQLTVNDDFGTATEVLKNLVMITADSLKIDAVVAKPDTQIVVPVYMDNKYQVSDIVFPIMIRKQDGSVPNYITLDSLVPDSGARLGYFERIKKQVSDNNNKRWVYLLNSNYYTSGSDYLEPGVGLAFNLYFTISASVSSSEVLILTDSTVSGWNLGFSSIVYDYTPVLVDGQITVATCDRGDANLDGLINILDITLLISWLYQGGYWPPDPVCGDVNADGTLNILDITYLIAFLYKGGPPPPP